MTNESASSLAQTLRKGCRGTQKLSNQDHFFVFFIYPWGQYSPHVRMIVTRREIQSSQARAFRQRLAKYNSVTIHHSSMSHWVPNSQELIEQCFSWRHYSTLLYRGTISRGLASNHPPPLLTPKQLRHQLQKANISCTLGRNSKV